MRKYFVFIGLGLVFIMGFAMYNSNDFVNKEADLVKWYTFNEGLEVAKTQNKVAMIDVYTDWCGYCEKLDDNTYHNKKVAEVLNQHFVSIKFNPEKEGSYTYAGKTYTGKQLERVFKVSGYPTIVFLKPDGGIKNVISGYYKPKEMMQVLEQVQ